MKKLKKLAHRLSTISNTESTIKNINSDFPELKIFTDSFQKVKNQLYTEDEKLIFEDLINYRNELLESKEIITYEIFNSDHKDTVGNIAKKAASGNNWCEFYYLLSKNYQVQNILEIGTNLGISGQYYLEGLESRENSLFVTMEGLPQLCKIASNRFHDLARNDYQFEVIEGLYEETFAKVLDKNLSYQLVFIDGNHQYEPTLYYFNQLKSQLEDHAIVIFDDIYWTPDMEKAWKEIQADKNVACSIDFFKMGVILFQKNPTKKSDYKLFLTKD